MPELNDIMKVLGGAGLKALDGKLESLVSSTDPGWKKTVLALVANAVEKHGVEGIALATQAVEDLLKGKAVDMNWADLAVASDVLAHLQNAEADKSTAVRAYLVQISQVLGTILSGILKSVL